MGGSLAAREDPDRCSHRRAGPGSSRNLSTSETHKHTENCHAKRGKKNTPVLSSSSCLFFVVPAQFVKLAPNKLLKYGFIYTQMWRFTPFFASVVSFTGCYLVSVSCISNLFSCVSGPPSSPSSSSLHTDHHHDSGVLLTSLHLCAVNS